MMLEHDADLLRYSRHLLLPQIDIAGQEALARARVLIVGAGGLGSPASLYLAAGGVGHITIADGDVVELSNLQRQIAHGEADLNANKAESAAASCRALNSTVDVVAVPRMLQDSELDAAVRAAHLVLDCTDNFATRCAVNRACAAAQRPLVSGAAIRFEGQLAVFDLRDRTSPCYQCLYEELPSEAETCARAGVAAPLVGIIGAWQALAAIQLLTGGGASLIGRLQLFDGLRSNWQQFTVPKNPSCPVCGGAT